MVNNREILVATPKMSSKNQIVMPKFVREKLGLKPSRKVIFRYDDSGRIIVESEKEQGVPKDIWKLEKENIEKFGSVDTPEYSFGKAVGHEVFD